jgi:hypothetical protein
VACELVFLDLLGDETWKLEVSCILGSLDVLLKMMMVLGFPLILD